MRRFLELATLPAMALFVVLMGCAGQTQPEVPLDLPQIASDQARIVLTREKQLAGAGSPIVFLDIGENLSPNAMLYIKGVPVEDILTRRDFASTSLTGIRYTEISLWFDRSRVNPLYCSDIGSGCIKYHWRWPKEAFGGFLYGTGVVIQHDCETRLGYFANDAVLRKMKNRQFESILMTGIPNCKIDLPAFMMDQEPRISAVPELHGYYALATAAEFVSSDKYITVPGYQTTYTEIYRYTPIDDRKVSRNVQVLGSAEVGDTLIWDRRPGVMRLGSAWWDGLGFMQGNVTVEPGKTYYIQYTTKAGQRWELTKVE